MAWATQRALESIILSHSALAASELSGMSGGGGVVVLLKHRLLGLTSEFQSLWVWKGAENLHT